MTAKVLQFSIATDKSSTVADRTKYREMQRFLWYGPALVRSARTRSAARLAGAAAVFVLVGVSVAAAAGPGVTLRSQIHALGAREHRALLDLYSLDSRLHAAQSRLAALQAQTEQLRNEQVLLGQQLFATRHTLLVSRRALGDNLSLLYKEGDVSALAVVLGSRSLDDAMTRLDDLSRVADQSRKVVQLAADAQTRLSSLRATLRQKQRTLAASVADAARTAASLTAARTERLAFIGSLRSRQRLKTRQIRALEASAKQVVQKSNELQAAAVASTSSIDLGEPPATVTPAAATEGRTLVVSTTGYSLPGHTATGMPVGWGVVAVDPAVIPLGTRLTIPGYGDAVAADTGSGVRGDSIDLWFPTLAQARAWGRRTVTITLH
jgi:3D (Asp-Asp-Asp) domain-containing protein